MKSILFTLASLSLLVSSNAFAFPNQLNIERSFYDPKVELSASETSRGLRCIGGGDASLPTQHGQAGSGPREIRLQVNTQKILGKNGEVVYSASEPFVTKTHEIFDARIRVSGAEADAACAELQKTDRKAYVRWVTLVEKNVMIDAGNHCSYFKTHAVAARVVVGAKEFNLVSDTQMPEAALESKMLSKIDGVCPSL